MENKFIEQLSAFRCSLLMRSKGYTERLHENNRLYQEGDITRSEFLEEYGYCMGQILSLEYVIEQLRDLYCKLTSV